MKLFDNLITIWFNEFKTIFRDKGILIFILFVPLCYPLLYSYVYTREVVREVPAAVVDDCNSALSREFTRKVDASPDVHVVARCANMAQAQELMRRQQVYGILHIPSSLERDLWQGNQSHIGLYCDMSSMLYYKALLLTTTNVSLDINRDIKVTRYIHTSTAREDEIARMPITYDYVPLYNPQSGFAAFLIPPVLMLIIQQTLLLGIGMSMGNTHERYQGSVVPLSPAYRNPVNIVLAKGAIFFVLYLLLGVYMFTLVTRWFALPQLGHYATFIAFLIPYLLACIFMAITLSFLIYRREDCILLFVFLSVPFLFLSGVSWPESAMSAVWKYVSYLIPSTWGMNGYVRIQSCGVSLADVAVEYRALWAQAGAYFITACVLYARRLRQFSRRRLHPAPVSSK